MKQFTPTFDQKSVLEYLYEIAKKNNKEEFIEKCKKVGVIIGYYGK